MPAAAAIEGKGPTGRATAASLRRSLNIGFVPMSDCAPLIAAQELGYFERAGLNVRLSKEVGWASVRERMLHHELDGSHAHASMLFELGCGMAGPEVSCLTGLMLAHNGSAISFSNELWDLGARNPSSLKRVIDEHRGSRRFRFAVVLKFSTQNYLLRQWLRNGGIDPEEDVEIVVVPPPQVFECLKKGYIDGYCAGEPWGSRGLLEGICWCAALTGEVETMHPEKVLLVHEDFERERHDEHIAMIGALVEAARYCDKPVNRAELAEMLALPQYLDVGSDALLNALQGPFQRGKGVQSSAMDAIVFNRNDASAPTINKANWVLNEIARNRLIPGNVLNARPLASIFRMDLYEEALTETRAARPA